MAHAHRVGVEQSWSSSLKQTTGDVLESARDELGAEGPRDPIVVVHEVRKAMKRLRALVKLAEGALSPKRLQWLDHKFRKVARRLAAQRDRDMLPDCLATLLKDLRSRDHDLDEPTSLPLDEATIRPIVRALNARQSPADPTDADAQARRNARLIQRLDALAGQVAQWRFRSDSWATLSRGLGSIYRRARQTGRVLESTPADDFWHAWRKRVKDHLYVTQWLQPIRPKTLQNQADGLAELASVLGREHDLIVLDQWLVEAREVDAETLRSWTLPEPDATPTDDEPTRPTDQQLHDDWIRAIEALRPAIATRRAELQADALQRGRVLYGEKTGFYLQRMHAYWRAWKSEAVAVQFP